MRNKFLAPLAALFISGAFSIAAGASNPKTTGDSGWPNGAVEAHTTFNAINTSPTGPAAKGSLIYSDPNIIYSMDVQFLSVDGNKAWFAGQVTSVEDLTGADTGCCRVGYWIFYQIEDNGEPGINVDHIWGEDLTAGEGIKDADAARAKVENHAMPLSGQITINEGNMQVKPLIKK
jgi:hypothetical protein